MAAADFGVVEVGAQAVVMILAETFEPRTAVKV